LRTIHGDAKAKYASVTPKDDATKQHEASVTEKAATDNMYVPTVASVPTENKTDPHTAASTTAKLASVMRKDNATKPHELSVAEGSKPTREHEVSSTTAKAASVTRKDNATKPQEASVAAGSVLMENEMDPHTVASATAKPASVMQEDNATKPHESSVAESSEPRREHEASVTEGSEPTRELSILSSIPHHIQECAM
jgi:hypothetical protein